MKNRNTIAIAAAGLLLYFAYDNYTGKHLLRELCAKDGGLRIYEPVHVDGYLDLRETDPVYCATCFERLVTGPFTFIDVKVSGDRATADPQAVQPGYYRLSVARKGDPRCGRWRGAVNTTEIERLQTLTGHADKCMAVEGPASESNSLELKHEFTKVPNNWGRRIELERYAITTSGGNRVVGEYRYYSFYRQLDYLATIGEKPSPVVNCVTPMQRGDDVAGFVTRVLRQPLPQPK